jgi:hypothetical protein
MAPSRFVASIFKSSQAGSWRWLQHQIHLATELLSSINRNTASPSSAAGIIV